MRRIAELDGLRAVLALWVVLVHCGKFVFPLNELPLEGFLFDEKTRVKVFFMISGMVVFGMLDRKHPQYSSYIVGRVLRIYPAYLAAILISVLMLPVAAYALQHSDFHAEFNQNRLEVIERASGRMGAHLGAHLTMLHGLLPPNVLSDAAYMITGQAWNIFTEFQFYLIAPFILWVAYQRGKLQIACVAVLALLAVAGRRYPNGAFIGRYTEFFAVGALSYVAFRRAQAFGRPTRAQVKIGLAVMLVMAGLAASYDWSISLWLGFLALLAPSYLFGSPFNLLSFLSTSTMRTMGNLSYSIYLSHMAVLFPVSIGLNYLQLDRTAYFLSLFMLTCVGATGLAWVLYRFVEVPAQSSSRLHAYAERTAGLFALPLHRLHRRLSGASERYAALTARVMMPISRGGRGGDLAR
jgi:peptidoglycan/LPS O-acetylase OafA/YrhL